MVAFAAGLALPFFLLALFPSYLKRLPRSGGWLARVKVVMGFVILAASLKYLASLDQVLQWGFLTRERFLAAWIVLFAMAGLYLLGFVRLEGIKPDENMGLGRLLIGHGVSDLRHQPGAGHVRRQAGRLWTPTFRRPRSGGCRRRRRRRPGLAEGPVPRGARPGAPRRQAGVRRFHRLRLRQLPLDARQHVHAAGDRRGACRISCWWNCTPTARTRCRENQKLELAKFGTVAEPFYAILDPDEKVVATFPGLTRDAAEFLAFLAKGSGVTNQGSGAAPAELPQLKSLDGGPVGISGSGKVAVVNFWATWCVPCIQEIPSFNQLERDFAAKGVAVVGVAMDEDGAELVKAFLKKHPMDYPVALGSPDLTSQYKLDELPVTLVFDRQGKQIKRFEGFLKEDELLAAVRQAL